MCVKKPTGVRERALDLTLYEMVAIPKVQISESLHPICLYLDYPNDHVIDVCGIVYVALLQ